MRLPQISERARFRLKSLLAVQFLLAAGLVGWKYYSRPLGLDGYCPVTLCQQYSWVMGNPDYVATYEGVRYQFATAYNRELFLKDPPNFAPVLSGCDVVRYSDEGVRSPGLRRFGFRYRERVYVFDSSETFEDFKHNPDHYAGLITH